MDKFTKIYEMMNNNQLDAFFLCNYEDRRYFTKFTGSNGYVFLTHQEKYLITDQRYTEQATNQADNFHVVTHLINPFETISKTLEKIKPSKIGYDSKQVTDYMLSKLKKSYDKVEWIPIFDVVLEIRSIKDEKELVDIKKAVELADDVMIEISKLIKPGVTEREIANQIEYLLRSVGSEGPSFGTIVAAGERASLPHAIVTDRVVKDGEYVLIDFGARYNGYMSDITRTIAVGKPNDYIQQIYKLVEEAIETTMNQIKPGLTCHEVDKLARDVFVKANVEQYSLRGLGHGVGLQIHEHPRIVLDNSQIIEEGMVFTVEPGLYIPNVGGVRLEDIVVVTSNGCEILTKTPRNLTVH